jgi:hypothetical protein
MSLLPSLHWVLWYSFSEELSKKLCTNTLNISRLTFVKVAYWEGNDGRGIRGGDGSQESGLRQYLALLLLDQFISSLEQNHLDTALELWLWSGWSPRLSTLVITFHSLSIYVHLLYRAQLRTL